MAADNTDIGQPNQPQRFMRHLMSKQREGAISVDDVKILAFSLFGDGLSTVSGLCVLCALQTAPTLINNLYCLGAHPAAQQRVYDELHAVTAGQPATAPITLDQLNAMPTLAACIKEAFRLYPVGTDVSRITQRQLTLSGYDIPTNVRVMLA